MDLDLQIAGGIGVGVVICWLLIRFSIWRNSRQPEFRLASLMLPVIYTEFRLRLGDATFHEIAKQAIARIKDLDQIAEAPQVERAITIASEQFDLNQYDQRVRSLRDS
ncbi:MAG: hypothetical protein F6K19_35065 [Cyanothece sp. SIO1E1]|nr:hypothetical protein [Cyanothece sp. SIO1E1]